jgi:phi13 family phage major tail protein
MPKTYFEYRGVSNAVYAEITADTAENFTTGAVKDLTGVSEIGKTTDSANETHYYDNLPAIVIDSVGSDEITINTSGIPLDVLADITGQYYDQTTGMLVEQESTPKYFAFGYITDKTDGTKVLVWRLKGKFSIPGTTPATKDDGTDANGQELTYTGISTVHKFTKTGKPARAINIDTSVNQTITEDDFFATVSTPDTIS